MKYYMESEPSHILAALHEGNEAIPASHRLNGPEDDSEAEWSLLRDCSIPSSIT